MNKHLSQDERVSLLSCHRTEQSGKVRDRIKAVLLADDGWTHLQIARALFIDEGTVSRHIQDYNNSQKLKNTSGGSEPKLNKQQAQDLSAHLEQEVYLDAHQIVAYVKKEFGITYSGAVENAPTL